MFVFIGEENSMHTGCIPGRMKSYGYSKIDLDQHVIRQVGGEFTDAEAGTD